MFFLCCPVSPPDKEGKEREKEKQQQQQAQLAVPRLGVSADEKIDKAKLAQTEVSPSSVLSVPTGRRNSSAWNFPRVELGAPPPPLLSRHVHG